MKGEPYSRKINRLRLEIIKSILSPNANVRILKLMLQAFNDARTEDKEAQKEQA